MRTGRYRRLLRKSIRNPKLEEAVRNIDRAHFLPDSEKHLSESNHVVPTCIRHGKVISTASQPSLVFEMLDMLDLEGNETVLDIGTGTGYSTALLSRMVSDGHVISIEYDSELANIAKERLMKLGIDNVTVLNRDGYYGYAEGAPYDAVISMVALGDFPAQWIEQLKAGGKVITPIAVYYDHTPVAELIKEDKRTLAGRFVIDAVFMTMPQHSESIFQAYSFRNREVTLKLVDGSSGQKYVEVLPT